MPHLSHMNVINLTPKSIVCRGYGSLISKQLGSVVIAHDHCRVAVEEMLL